jgi:hypothetical protein
MTGATTATGRFQIGPMRVDHVEVDEPEGSIHTNDDAHRYGFESALVPGIHIFAAALAPIVEQAGDDWFATGRASLRHRRPVYEGETLDVEYAQDPTDPDRSTLTIRNQRGEDVALGGFGTDAGGIPPRRITAPDAASGVVEKVLALPGALRVGQYVRFLPRSVDDTPFESRPLPAGPIDCERALAVPVQVSTAAGFETFDYVSPGIHYAAHIRYFARAPRDSSISGTGIVTKVYERNRNHFFEMEFQVFANDLLIAVVDHTIMYVLAERLPA